MNREMLQHRCCVSRHQKGVHLTIYLSLLFHSRVQQSMNSIILREISFLWTMTQCELKIFRKLRCKQMGCHLCFVPPFIEHRQRRFSMIPKAHRTFLKWSVCMGFDLKVVATLALTGIAWPVLWSYAWLLFGWGNHR